MIRTKGANQSPQFQTFNCLREVSTNLYFDKFHLLKVYKISTKKLEMSHVPPRLKSDKKFEEKLICCSKIDKNLVNFDPITQKSQKFVL